MASLTHLEEELDKILFRELFFLLQRKRFQDLYGKKTVEPSLDSKNLYRP